MEGISGVHKLQYENDLVYLVGGKPKWNGSISDFIGKSVGFVMGYIYESQKTPEQARIDVEERENMIQEWRDSQPKSVDQIKVSSFPRKLLVDLCLN